MAVLVAAVVVGGCSEADGDHASPAARSDEPPALVTKPAPESAVPVSGVVAGRVTWQGAAPKPRVLDVSCDSQCVDGNPNGLTSETVLVDADGNLANVVVYIDDVPQDHGGPKGADRPMLTLDQVACRFVPHVLAVQSGQDVKVRNSDPGMHCVHFVSRLNGDSNFTQPPGSTDPVRTPLVKPELGAVFKCDVHPWMKSMVAIFDHPYFAVSGADGSFQIDTTGLPDGTYQVRAWHEKYKHAPARQVTVTKHRGASVQFSFQPNK
jgi:hypothetical protein